MQTWNMFKCSENLASWTHSNRTDGKEKTQEIISAWTIALFLYTPSLNGDGYILKKHTKNFVLDKSLLSHIICLLWHRWRLLRVKGLRGDSGFAKSCVVFSLPLCSVSLEQSEFSRSAIRNAYICDRPRTFGMRERASDEIETESYTCYLRYNNEWLVFIRRNKIQPRQYNLIARAAFGVVKFRSWCDSPSLFSTFLRQPTNIYPCSKLNCWVKLSWICHL